MMHEVLRRRFERRAGDAGDYDESFAALPDLVVVDGGKGQLSAAVAALEDAASKSIVGLAKQREEVFVPGRRDPCSCRPTTRARCCCSASATRRTASR